MSANRNLEPGISSKPDTASKRRYGGPTMVEVGRIEEVTTGHTTPVADMAPGTDYGYYDASKTMDDGAEVDLEGH